MTLVAVASLVGCAADERHDLVARSDVGDVTRAELEGYILSMPADKRRPDPDQNLHDWRQARLKDLLLTKAFEVQAEDLLDGPGAQSRLQRARLSVLVEAYTSTYIDAELDLSDEAIRQYYDQHIYELGNPDQIRLRHIFRRVDADAPASVWATTRAEMEELLSKLKADSNFGDIARTESDSETAPRHGLIGRLDRGTLDPELEEIVWNLEDGELSEVIETPVGFHIFKLDNHIPAARVDFDEARGRLARRMKNEHRERQFSEQFARLQEESGAVFRPELIESEDEVDPSTPVFELDDHVIRLADVTNYVNRTGFVELRRLPPLLWLENAARNRLFAWKAEKENLDEKDEVARQMKSAATKEKVQMVIDNRLQPRIVELEANGELRKHYDEHYLRFQTPMLHRFRIITVNFDRFAKPYDAYEFADDLAGQIRAGKIDMADAARRYSDDPSASAGGDLGWLRFDAFGTWFGPRVQNAVAGVGPGVVTDPLLMEYYDQSQLGYDRTGYVLVRLENVKEPEIRPYEEVRQQVQQRYIDRHRRQLEETIRETVLEEIHAEIIEENL